MYCIRIRFHICAINFPVWAISRMPIVTSTKLLRQQHQQRTCNKRFAHSIFFVVAVVFFIFLFLLLLLLQFVVWKYTAHAASNVCHTENTMCIANNESNAHIRISTNKYTRIQVMLLRAGVFAKRNKNWNRCVVSTISVNMLNWNVRCRLCDMQFSHIKQGWTVFFFFFSFSVCNMHWAYCAPIPAQIPCHR